MGVISNHYRYRAIRELKCLILILQWCNGENEYCKNMRFLGIDYNGYPLLVFELENGKTVIRQLFDSSLRYELVEYK
jgi:hypothetical protein